MVFGTVCVDVYVFWQQLELLSFYGSVPCDDPAGVMTPFMIKCEEKSQSQIHVLAPHYTHFVIARREMAVKTNSFNEKRKLYSNVRQSIYLFFFPQKIIKCENCETETRLPSCDGANVGCNVVLLSAEMESRLVMMRTDLKLLS